MDEATMPFLGLEAIARVIEGKLEDHIAECRASGFEPTDDTMIYRAEFTHRQLRNWVATLRASRYAVGAALDRIAEMEREKRDLNLIIETITPFAQRMEQRANRAEAALAATMSGVPSGSREPVNGNGDGT